MPVQTLTKSTLGFTPAFKDQIKTAQSFAAASGKFKRLALFCDGTWQTDEQEKPTNVVLMFRAIRQTADSVPQVSYYLDGVGTGGNDWDNWFGGAFGNGIEARLIDGYIFLMQNFEPGDEIFLNGYSRGAFMARSIAGMINKAGLLSLGKIAKTMGTSVAELRTPKMRPWLENHAAMALRFYKDKNVKPSSPEAATWRKKYSHTDTDGNVISRITGLSCFDTVGSLGIPDNIPGSEFVNDRHKFHDTRISKIIDFAWQACAIDEQRSNTFGLTPMQLDAEHLNTSLRQVWFPGDHGIGGGDNGFKGLSDAAAVWMIEQIEEQTALRFDPVKVASSFKPNPNDAPYATFWNNGDILYQVSVRAPRVIPVGNPLSEAAKQRIVECKPAYRPEAVFGPKANPGLRRDVIAYAKMAGADPVKLKL